MYKIIDLFSSIINTDKSLTSKHFEVIYAIQGGPLR